MSSLSLLALALFTLQARPDPAPAEPNEGRVKVFVLAGQSNMEGKGFPEPVAWQVGQAQYRDRWTRYIANGDHAAFTAKYQASVAADPRRPVFDWSVRDDVWVKFLGRHGPLTVGYAAPDKCFGPEYEFGHAMGDLHDEPVLIIKCAWGGKSLGRDFLPPSAPQPGDEEFANMVRERNERIAQENLKNREKHEQEQRPGEFRPRPLVQEAEIRESYGHYYRLMIEDVKATLADLDTSVPGATPGDAELVGFVWFQGWNDQFDPNFSRNYERNLEHLIRDVRRDLGAPDMKAVIGVVGFDGSDEPTMDREGEPTARTLIQRGQAAMATVPDFVGNVDVVRTAPCWDQDANDIYHGPGGWSADPEKWRHFGNDRPYHYLGSPWFFAQAGRAFGECMVKLIEAD